VTSHKHPQLPGFRADHARDAGLDAMVATLSEARLIEEVIDDGKPSVRLTAEGTQMALSSEDDAQVLLRREKAVRA
jgi:hypothetical protein